MAFPVGEVASLSAAACWAVGLTLFRGGVTEIGARAVNLFKGVFGTTLFLGLVLAFGFTAGSPRAQLEIVLSGVLGIALGDTLLFLALAELGAHRAALFGCLGPVFTALGAWWLLDERLAPAQVAGIGLAAGGVWMVVYDRRRADDPAPPSLRGVACGLLSAVCQAGGVLLAKRAMEEVDFLSAVTVRLAAATLALALLAVLRGELAPTLRNLARPRMLRRLAPAAFFGTFAGLLLMQLGIARTDSAVASALHSTTPLFTLPVALLFLRQRVGALAVAGSFLAVAGVALLVLTGVRL